MNRLEGSIAQVQESFAVDPAWNSILSCRLPICLKGSSFFVGMNLKGVSFASNCSHEPISNLDQLSMSFDGLNDVDVHAVGSH